MHSKTAVVVRSAQNLSRPDLNAAQKERECTSRNRTACSLHKPREFMLFEEAACLF
jgi:hypothetical protein